MEHEEDGEPIAKALYGLVMAESGAHTADQRFMDAVVIGLCRSLPPLAAEIEAVLQDMAEERPDLEPACEAGYDARLQTHLTNLAALVRTVRTR